MKSTNASFKSDETKTCLVALVSCVDSRDTASQNPEITPKDSIDITNLYKASQSKEKILERYHKVEQKNANKLEKHGTKTMLFDEKYDK